MGCVQSGEIKKVENTQEKLKLLISLSNLFKLIRDNSIDQAQKNVVDALINFHQGVITSLKNNFQVYIYVNYCEGLVTRLCPIFTQFATSLIEQGKKNNVASKIVIQEPKLQLQYKIYEPSEKINILPIVRIPHINISFDYITPQAHYDNKHITPEMINEVKLQESLLNYDDTQFTPNQKKEINEKINIVDLHQSQLKENMRKFQLKKTIA